MVQNLSHLRVKRSRWGMVLGSSVWNLCWKDVWNATVKNKIFPSLFSFVSPDSAHISRVSKDKWLTRRLLEGSMDLNAGMLGYIPKYVFWHVIKVRWLLGGACSLGDIRGQRSHNSRSLSQNGPEWGHQPGLTEGPKLSQSHGLLLTVMCYFPPQTSMTILSFALQPWADTGCSWLLSKRHPVGQASLVIWGEDKRNSM